jgi:peptide/nickel transport system substrate-binding protein
MFDITMRQPLDYQAPSLPWARFDCVMSSADYAPPGQEMYENWGRYRNPQADSLLRLLPKLSDDQQITAAYKELNQLFMKELPMIPLLYRPWLFYQFSTRHWTNFPTETNPTAPPQCLMVGAGVKALWELKSTGK